MKFLIVIGVITVVSGLVYLAIREGLIQRMFGVDEVTEEKTPTLQEIIGTGLEVKPGTAFTKT